LRLALEDERLIYRVIGVSEAHAAEHVGRDRGSGGREMSTARVVPGVGGMLSSAAAFTLFGHNSKTIQFDLA
jgi:hypothetical protein